MTSTSERESETLSAIPTGILDSSLASTGLFKHSEHTLTFPCPGRTFFWSEQGPQTTLPHWRQWWRRFVKVNFVVHIAHVFASLSGIHTGAAVVTTSSLLRSNVSVRILSSSWACLMQSSHSFFLFGIISKYNKRLGFTSNLKSIQHFFQLGIGQVFCFHC